MIINWKEVEGIASSITALSFLFGIFFTVINIRISNKLRRTDLLNSLFEKFFYDKKYAEIRGVIDYSFKNEKSMETLLNSLKHKTDTENEEKFVDFFNFFEFIAVLKKLGQLKTKEIKYMFEYYFRMLGKNEAIMQYLKDNGFENLIELIEGFEK